jgi:hypothetical protein
MPQVHRLTADGLKEFEVYLDAGASGPAPVDAIARSGGATAVEPAIDVGVQPFATRFQLGQYLHGVLDVLGRENIAHDPSLWNWLALLYFESICPARPDGSRKILGREHYILSSDYRKYYRHLLAAPYTLFDLHRDSARVLLHSAIDKHGDFVEQLASRQDVITNRALIKAVDSLYWAAGRNGGRPKRGATDRARPGSLRRLVAVIQQLELTYDLHAMTDAQILGLLPAEFGSWRG